MNNTTRWILIILGSLSALMIVAQLVMGQLIYSGRVSLVTAHRHSGYTAVAVILVYIVMSLSALLSMPREARRP